MRRETGSSTAYLSQQGASATTVSVRRLTPAMVKLRPADLAIGVSDRLLGPGDDLAGDPERRELPADLVAAGPASQQTRSSPASASRVKSFRRARASRFVLTPVATPRSVRGPPASRGNERSPLCSKSTSRARGERPGGAPRCSRAAGARPRARHPTRRLPTNTLSDSQPTILLQQLLAAPGLRVRGARQRSQGMRSGMTDRREFLTFLASAVAAAGVRDAVAAPPDESPNHQVRATAAAGSLENAYTFFSSPEAEFVEAAVSRLIPKDELGPGALEAAVPYYIDRLLTTEYGSGARFYNRGPFGATTPYQGYQSPLTPPEVYRIGIAATNRYCEQKYGRRFGELDPAAQDDVLKGLQDVSLEDVPGATFFGQLLADTKDGFFSDPVYGGNRGMIGWKLVGYPGVPA